MGKIIFCIEIVTKRFFEIFWIIETTQKDGCLANDGGVKIWECFLKKVYSFKLSSYNFLFVSLKLFRVMTIQHNNILLEKSMFDQEINGISGIGFLLQYGRNPNFLEWRRAWMFKR